VGCTEFGSCRTAPDGVNECSPRSMSSDCDGLDRRAESNQARRSRN
jgi:hypothetical protein